jgi:hypothetical protein
VNICTFCGSKTELAIDGAPLCEQCSGKAESEIGKQNTGRQIRAALQREILACTARAHDASEELIAIMGDIPSGLPQPDGSLRIQNAARALAAARNDVIQAHSRLNEFLARGAKSEDREPGDRTG